MLSPAHAIKKYSKDNGNIACSSCHSRTGLSNGTMYPLTGIGSYFKTNGALPPRAAPQPTAQPVNPQQQPYTPPRQPVIPQPVRNPHVDYCRRKYRSYKVATDTWRGYDGIVRRCISPSSRGQQPVQPYNPPVRVAPRPYVPPRVVPRPYTPPPRVRTPVRQSGNYSCNQAKRLIRNQGYNNVTAKNCADFGRYTFFAYQRGVRYRLRIRASDGVIYKRQRK